MNHENLIEQAQIFKDGMETDFWRELDKLLTGLREDAISNLLATPPNEPGAIAEFQAIAKVALGLKHRMLDIIQEADFIRREERGAQ